MKELVIACCRVAQKKSTLVVDEQSKEYWRWRDTILHNEDVLLEALCFDLSYDQPYKILFKYLKWLGEEHNKGLRDSAWTFLTDSGATMLCLLYPSRVIAASALYCSARYHRLSFEDRDGGAWWDDFGLSLSDIKKACNYMALARDEARPRPSDAMYTCIPEDENADKVENRAKSALTARSPTPSSGSRHGSLPPRSMASDGAKSASTGRDAQPRPKRPRDDGGSTGDGAAKHDKNDAIGKVGASTAGGNAHGAPHPSKGPNGHDTKRRRTKSVEPARVQNGAAGTPVEDGVGKVGASTTGGDAHGVSKPSNGGSGHDKKRRRTESVEPASVQNGGVATPVEDAVGKVGASATGDDANGASQPSKGPNGHDKKPRGIEGVEPAPVQNGATKTPVESEVGTSAAGGDANGAPPPSNSRNGKDKKRRRTESVEPAPVPHDAVATPVEGTIGEVGASSTDDNAHGASQPLNDQNGRDTKRRKTGSVEPALVQNGAIKTPVESAIGEVGASKSDDNAHSASQPSNGQNGHDTSRRSTESAEPAPVQNDAVATAAEDALSEEGEVES